MLEKKNIELQSYLQQFKDFINRNDYTEIDIKDLLFKILDTLNEDDLKDLVNFIENRYPKLLGGLVEQLETIAIDNNYYGKILGREFYILETIRKQISFSKRSNNTEMHTALLTGMLVNYHKSNNNFLKTLYRSVAPLIYEALMHNYNSLRDKIEFGHYLNIESALCIFFFYEKPVAFRKFKNLISKDIEQNQYSAYKMEYRVAFQLFFERLALAYIPQLEINLPKISFSEQNESITRYEIDCFIDDEDYFNKRIPLGNLQRNELLNPENNFKDLEGIKNVLSEFFSTELKIDLNIVIDNNELKIVEVFIDTISIYSPDYSKDQLVAVREHIKKGFKNKTIKTRFLALLYCLKAHEYLSGATHKIDVIISEYFGKDIFSKSRVRSIFNRNAEKKEDEIVDDISIAIDDIFFNYF